MPELIAERLKELKHVPNQGNPAKGMDALLDVARGEGRATGRSGKEKLPMWLCLGSDLIADLRARLDNMKEVVDEWESVETGLGEDGL